MRITRTSITIPAYPYQDFLTPVPAESYGFAFPRLDWGAYEASHPAPAPRQWEALVLENAHLRAVLLPELGGRIYQLILKENGHNVLYNNPVLKPTHWGPAEQGWWLAAGGIEFCLPVEEHGYETALPWQYTVETSQDAVAVDLYDSDDEGRLRAAVRISLRAGESMLHVRVRLENGTNRDLDVKYWSNAMLAPGPDNRAGERVYFVVPANEVLIHSAGEAGLPAAGTAMPWPIWQGRDMRFPWEWRGWLGFFAWPQVEAGFAGVYDDAADEGIVRVFDPRQAQGVKGFAFGHPDYALPAEMWTDDGSFYVELHGGLMRTFAEAFRLAPAQTITFEEAWMPTAGLGGLSLAGPSGAAHLRWDASAGEMRLTLMPARTLEGHAELYIGDEMVGSMDTSGAPGEVLQGFFPWPEEPAWNSPLSLWLIPGKDEHQGEEWRGYYRPVPK